MAARHLQRLRQSDALSPAAAPESASDSEPSPVSKPFNKFDLLSDEVLFKSYCWLWLMLLFFIFCTAYCELLRGWSSVV